ncbi:MAG TPA: hypothetical protein VFK68_13670, partial [Propionibacteriaceae bacterium]|nr:hypothetical protein [Propionibacteriaceae bacterium]
THGADGRATRLTEVFAQLGLRRHASTAIDVDLLRARVAATSEGDPTLWVLVTALTGVLEAAVALTDPEVVVLGGAWGRDPAVVGALRRCMVDLPRAVDVVPACLADQPQLAGARAAALEKLREAIVTTIRSPGLGVPGHEVGCGAG